MVRKEKCIKHVYIPRTGIYNKDKDLISPVFPQYRR